MRVNRFTCVVLFVSGCLALGGCGLFGWLDRGEGYENSRPAKPLEVPPDLSEPVRDTSMKVPSTAATVEGPVGEAPEPPDLDDSPLPEAPEIDLPRDEAGAPYLVLDDTIQSAWRRTGYALERSGFTIQTRDESRWLYSIVYVPAAEKEDGGGFFSWLFGRDDEPPEEKQYHVSLVGTAEDQTRVMVLNDAGDPETATAAERILSLLADRLKS